MQITGMIKHGQAVIKPYSCIKCLKRVEIVLISGMSEKTIDCFSSMLDSQLCLDCHCDSKVPELVECLVH